MRQIARPGRWFQSAPPGNCRQFTRHHPDSGVNSKAKPEPLHRPVHDPNSKTQKQEPSQNPNPKLKTQKLARPRYDVGGGRSMELKKRVKTQVAAKKAQPPARGHTTKATAW